MSTPRKRREVTDGTNGAKRMKKNCSYGENCYRRNPAHLREFSHPHLEAILDEHQGDGAFPIPAKFHLQRDLITEQLEIIVEKKLYVPGKNGEVSSSTQDNPPKAEASPAAKPQLTQPSQPRTQPSQSSSQANQPSSQASQPSSQVNQPGAQMNQPSAQPSPSQPSSQVNQPRAQANLPRTQVNQPSTQANQPSTQADQPSSQPSQPSSQPSQPRAQARPVQNQAAVPSSSNMQAPGPQSKTPAGDSSYRPIVPPKRRPEEFLKVVRPPGAAAARHAASAPYHVFYTTITDAGETHGQPYSITFLELLDPSLGELKCSLQINFMVEPGWLLAQYYFAGYSAKRLTILYGDDSDDMRTLSQKKPHVDAHHITMPTPFGTHHTKMMILCYEDGSLRVVISTANLYVDDWENRTQGLWFSPSCPELPPSAMAHEGESPTFFKRSLLRYLARYHLPCLAYYTERVKRCDFSSINVFFVGSVPGSHFDDEWGLGRVATLLRQHCAIPTEENSKWPLIAQASSLGSFGKEPKVWLTGDFLHHFTKIKNPPQMLSPQPELKLIYPSLENVRQSHDDLLGGGCLPYGANVHTKQLWLNDFLYQWKATHTGRNKAMPHIKTYTRTHGSRAAFYLLTSGNTSKAAWGARNKKDGALRILSYEAGVLFLPKFVINQDFFPLEEGAENRLIIPYDLPPTKYTPDMSPFVSDYLR